MREHDNHDQVYDPFGWLKTLGAIIMVFAIMIGSGIATARADPCADACRTKHNECRIQTKGSRECESKHNVCIQSCLTTLQQNLVPPAKKN